MLAACSGDPEANEAGATAPALEMEDFQPQSPRFGETYGLEEFRGSVLFLPLYAGWCNTCVACAYFLNPLYKEWQAEGLNVRVAAINPINGLNNQKALIEVCDFPLLQDNEQSNAWDTLRGTKDDLYIYTPDGVLSSFTDYTGASQSAMFSVAGKAKFRAAIIEAGG